MRGVANVCAQYYYHFERQQQWIDRCARRLAQGAAAARLPEVKVARPRSSTRAASTWTPPTWRRRRSPASTAPRAPASSCSVACSPPASTRTSPRSPTPRSRRAARLQRLPADLQRAGRPRQAGGGAETYAHAPQARSRAHLLEVPRGRRARVPGGRQYAAMGRVDDADTRGEPRDGAAPVRADVHYNAACTFGSVAARSRRWTRWRQGLGAGFRDDRLGARRPRPRHSPRRSGVRAAVSGEARRGAAPKGEKAR